MYCYKVPWNSNHIWLKSDWANLQGHIFPRLEARLPTGRWFWPPMYGQLGQSGTNLSQAHINVNMQLHPQPGVYSLHASLLIIIKWEEKERWRKHWDPRKDHSSDGKGQSNTTQHSLCLSLFYQIKNKGWNWMIILNPLPKISIYIAITVLTQWPISVLARCELFHWKLLDLVSFFGFYYKWW